MSWTGVTNPSAKLINFSKKSSYFNPQIIYGIEKKLEKFENDIIESEAGVS